MTIEVYICVDVETAGPVPSQYALLSIGACLVEEPERSFYIELQPDREEFLPEAMAISGLSPEDLKKKVDPQRLQRVLAEGAVEPAAMGLIEYWGGRSVAGLLLMPPTRHNFVHLNEALRLKQKIHLSRR